MKKIEIDYLLKNMGEILEEDLNNISLPDVQFEDFSEEEKKEKNGLERKSKIDISKKKMFDTIKPFLDSYLRRTYSNYANGVIRLNEKLRRYPSELKIVLAHELTHFVDEKIHVSFWKQSEKIEKRWVETLGNWIDGKVTIDEIAAIQRKRMLFEGISEGRALFVGGEIARSEEKQDVYDLFNMFDCVFFPEYQIRICVSAFIERLKKEGYKPVLVVQNIPTYEEIETMNVEKYLKI